MSPYTRNIYSANRVLYVASSNCTPLTWSFWNSRHLLIFRRLVDQHRVRWLTSSLSRSFHKTHKTYADFRITDILGTVTSQDVQYCKFTRSVTFPTGLSLRPNCAANYNTQQLFLCSPLAKTELCSTKLFFIGCCLTWHIQEPELELLLQYKKKSKRIFKFGSEMNGA
jgi:hypothetical protein